MLSVKTPEEVSSLIIEEFLPCMGEERIPLCEARGRVLSKDVNGKEYVPGFNRSTVDGFAVRAADTFGCSDALPALLIQKGEVAMGAAAEEALDPGQCIAVSTGGAVPPNADAVVMIEYTEAYGDGTIGICKSVAPGANMIYCGDDVYPGKRVFSAGRCLTAQDIGALAALGETEVLVCRKPLVGIFSTGDELVPVKETPCMGQVRDVNSVMLQVMVGEFGALSQNYGIIPDQEELLSEALAQALDQCDMVLISGGSSVGKKDTTCKMIEAQGEILLHGIAMKPGKPTILGKVKEKPVVGLPGHPVAAFFVARLFVRELLARMAGCRLRHFTVPAILTETVHANHGRAQYMGVFLSYREGRVWADPIRAKSGLITALAASDGYFSIPRDCEGVAAGETVQVTLYTVD